MYLMYIDESGNTGTNYKDIEQPIFTMAGIIVKDSNWLKIDRELSELKRNLFGRADMEIHAQEMFNPRKTTPFWGVRSQKENWDDIEKIVDFMIKYDMKSVSCSISKQYIKNILRSDIKVDPYYFGLILLSYRFDEFLEENNEKGIIITDKIDSIDERVTRLILEKLRLEEEDKVKDIVERPLRTDSAMSNMVQLADIFAFFRNKLAMLSRNNELNNLTAKEDYTVKIMNKLKQMSYVNGNAINKLGAWVDKFKNLVVNEIISSEDGELT